MGGQTHVLGCVKGIGRLSEASWAKQLAPGARAPAVSTCQLFLILLHCGSQGTIRGARASPERGFTPATSQGGL